MMYKIRYIGDPILRQKTKRVEIFNDKLEKIIKSMFDIMHKEEGIGLAGPQVGIQQSIIVVDISCLEKNEHPKAFINPKIIDRVGESVVEEGCLSIPGVREDVSRSEQITLTYFDEMGEKTTDIFNGWMARVIQHEVDHLHGILFVDHISPVKRLMLMNKRLIPEVY